MLPQTLIYLRACYGCASSMLLGWRTHKLRFGRVQDPTGWLSGGVLTVGVTNLAVQVPSPGPQHVLFIEFTGQRTPLRVSLIRKIKDLSCTHARASAAARLRLRIQGRRRHCRLHHAALNDAAWQELFAGVFYFLAVRLTELVGLRAALAILSQRRERWCLAQSQASNS